MSMTWFWVGAITVLVIALIFFWRQATKSKIIIHDLEKDRVDLERRIEDIKAAQALTDLHRKDMAILNKDQDDINEDLRNAKGYSDPLPPDVSRALDRLRAGKGAPRRATK